MLDLPRLKRIRLMKRPIGQVFFGHTVLTPNYNRFPGIDIRVEGMEKIPNEPVIYAMNHTDRYNYWPFQYQLYRERLGHTATWVKGKYYDAYVMIDIYSRYIVGVQVRDRESGLLAKEMMMQVFGIHGIPHVVHADRGTSMTSKTVAALLADLEVTRSHSRPKVSLFSG